MKIKWMVIFVTLLLCSPFIIPLVLNEPSVKEVRGEIEGVCRYWVYLPSEAEPGDLLPIKVKIRGLNIFGLDFIVSVRVIYGYKRASDWKDVIITHLTFLEEEEGITAVRIPIDVETGPVIIWLDIWYRGSDYYVIKKGKRTYVLWDTLIWGPYIKGYGP